MKKTVCLILSMIFVLFLTSCGDKEKKPTPDVDLEYYAELGEIPECKYKLGADIDNLKAELEAEDKAALDKGEEYVYSVTEGEKSVSIDNGSAIYYYEKAKESEGVSYIVSRDKAYGFESGTSILDVKKSLEGYEYTTEAANEDNVFFLFGTSDGEVLKYTFKNKVIMFVFQENALSAAAIYDTDNWTL